MATWLGTLRRLDLLRHIAVHGIHSQFVCHKPGQVSYQAALISNKVSEEYSLYFANTLYVCIYEHVL